MSRKFPGLFLALCLLLSGTVIAGAAETDSDYSDARATLSVSGISDGASLAMDTAALQLPIELGMLDDADSLPLTELATRALQLRQERRQAQDEAVIEAASNAAVLVQYDGVMIIADALELYESPDEDAAAIRTIQGGKVARLLDRDGAWYQVEFGTSTGYVAVEGCAPVSYADYEGTAAASTIIEDLILHSFSYLGVPYRYGGASYSGVDCSGFTMAVYAAFGYALPHGSSDQYYVTRRVSFAELQSGDLVFFNTFGGISHVGIYLGDGRFIHANSRLGVHIDSLSGYWTRVYVGAGRVIG
jgi:cell wall-associated NlpC family hydrolase